MKLKEFRLKHCLTQRELAKTCGVKRNTVTRWEMGITMPGLKRLIQLANLYNCTIDELIKD